MGNEQEKPLSQEDWDKERNRRVKLVENQLSGDEFGRTCHYSTDFISINIGGEQRMPLPNMQIEMSNIPSSEADGLPKILNPDELIRLWVAVEPDNPAQMARLDDEEKARVESFRKNPILEYEAKLVIGIGIQDRVPANFVLEDEKLCNMPRFVLDFIRSGTMDIAYAKSSDPVTYGRYLKRDISLTRLRRILQQRRTPSDGKIRPERYEVAIFNKGTPREMFGFMVEALDTATGTTRITHVVFGRKPRAGVVKTWTGKGDGTEPDLDTPSDTLGSSRTGRGWIIILEYSDAIHAVLTYHGELLPDNDQNTPSCHSIWLAGRPTLPKYKEFKRRVPPGQKEPAKRKPRAPKKAAPNKAEPKQADQPPAAPAQPATIQPAN